MSLSSPITKPTPLSPAQMTQIEAVMREGGFEQFGVAELSTPLTLSVYEEWIAKEFHGEMDYLERHVPEKREPRKLMPQALSAIVVTKNYVPHPAPAANFPVSESVGIASYARGRDYHHFLTGRLNAAIKKLKEIFPDEEFLCFTDSGPILERDLARRAGIGWVGKNSMILSKTEGSLFFIGEIFTTLAAPETAALEAVDHCGTCTRCLDACPTQAIVAPREVDARRCISYLTIEARTPPTEELRSKMGNWIFGCDICQTVCPWNIKLVKSRGLTMPLKDNKIDLVNDLRWLLTASNRSIDRAFKGTPLKRAGGINLKKNAMIVAVNAQIFELRADIEQWVTHPRLEEVARWALEKLARADSIADEEYAG